MAKERDGYTDRPLERLLVEVADDEDAISNLVGKEPIRLAWVELSANEDGSLQKLAERPKNLLLDFPEGTETFDIDEQ